jgi:hypothetical protein
MSLRSGPLYLTQNLALIIYNNILLVYSSIVIINNYISHLQLYHLYQVRQANYLFWTEMQYEKRKLVCRTLYFIKRG